MLRKSNLLWFDTKILILLIAFHIQNVTSFWEYAVCTKEKIILYDNNWSQLETSITADGLKQMKAITFDPVHDVFYFTDQRHPKTSIFSLKVRNDTTFLIEPLVARSTNEVIQDLVYDFHDDALFWSDSGNKKIVKLIFDRNSSLKMRAETFMNSTENVAGLEIDTCQRNLFYTITTNDNPSINIVSLDEKVAQPISFGNPKHYKPTAIAMDHQERRLYVGDWRPYNTYSVDSLLANGNDFRTEIESTHKTPRSIAVDSDYVYYVEGSDRELRRFRKKDNINKMSEDFKSLPFDPNDIIVRSNFIVDLDPKACKVSTTKLEKAKNDMEINAQKPLTIKTCLHGGTFDKTSSNCMCHDGFEGDVCEINLCYNFCLHGVCSMELNEMENRIEPKCSCNKDFVGDHCEIAVCTKDYCLNGGKCQVDVSKKPLCSCNKRFNGARCENAKLESSPAVVKPVVESTTSAVKPTKSAVVQATKVPESSTESLTEHLESSSHHEEIIAEPEQFTCSPNSANITYIILAVCFTLSLLIFLVILVVIKKFSRPMRPKIRKKFVVHKNIEPMTYRPTTEQCEVIIEDCCNMNICETPCFDPKVLQQEINEGNISVKLTSSKKCNSNKEDKQDLLKHMELNQ